MHRTHRAGFSLIEVLVVVSIIALLIALLLPALLQARTTAEDSQCISNIGALMKAQLSYVLDHDQYYTHYDEWVWNRDQLGEQAKGHSLPAGVQSN